MKKLLIITILFSNFAFTQSQDTKFTMNGNILSGMYNGASVSCQFLKREKVEVINYVGENWLEVKTSNCTGYVLKHTFKMTPEINSLIKIREDKIRLEEKENRRRDSIKRIEQKRTDSINLVDQRVKDSLYQIRKRGRDSIYRIKQRRIDSIAKVEKEKQKQIILRHGLDPEYPLILSGRGLKGSLILLSKPNDSADEIMTIMAYDVIGLSYTKGYFKVYHDSHIGYIDEKLFFINENEMKLINRSKIRELEKKYGKTIGNLLRKGHYWIGMTDDMAIAAGWYPGSSKVNRTVTRYGTSEQWVCKRSVYLYFKDGILTSYQD